MTVSWKIPENNYLSRFKKLNKVIMKIILWILAAILVLGWIIGFFVFHILGGLIHLLLIGAAILLIYNFISGMGK